MLVTATPSHKHWAGGRPMSSSPPDGGSGVPSGEGGREHDRDRRGKAEEAEKARSRTNPPSSSTRLQASKKSLINAAPLPLLVFDTATLLVLGEFDEQFAFQGGVAEWISRAKFKSRGKDVDFKSDVHDIAACPTTSGGLCSDQAVQHVDEREWGARFVGTCPEDRFQLGGSTAEQRAPDVTSPSEDRNISGVPEGGFTEQVFLRQGTDEDEFVRREAFPNSATSEEVTLDQWNRLPLAKLEVLLQADADLFFLRLLLLPPPSG